MKLTKALLTALAIATASVATVTAHADDYREFQLRQDADFGKTVQKAVDILTKKGYQVGEVDVDYKWGKPVLEIEAYKNHQEYDIVMSYPDLKILSERPDW